MISMNRNRQPHRRTALKVLTGLGIGTATFQRSLASQAEKATEVTADMLLQAEWVADIELTDEERESTLSKLNKNLQSAARVRETEVEYNVGPCTVFRPDPFLKQAESVVRNQAVCRNRTPLERPDSDNDIAFLPVHCLARLIRHQKITSTELTRIYLDRLKKYDPILKCVVSLTEDLAVRQAAQADEEISSGEYRGPLHGIPWGAKDLMAVPGYPTTWGATPYQNQTFDHTATIAERLEAAGAVLVAKLSLGALAMGDKWMKKQTRNPWYPKQGSSGSSAGSASATAAGLVGFAIGTETLGSIVSPSRRCGTTSLRPTFGRISRYGLMPLSWTMDKAGPMCRSVEDCALVLDAIHGTDGKDPNAADQPFVWPEKTDLSKLRVGYVKNSESIDERNELRILREVGVQLIPITLPKELPVWELVPMLDVEAATMFDQVTREHITEGLNTWPDTFRAAQMIPAVEYVRASRVRSMLIQEMKSVFQKVDLYVGGRDLGITNLTGHPTVVMPAGFVERNKVKLPYSVTMTGDLYSESRLLAVAEAFQAETDFHKQQPPLNKWVKPEPTTPTDPKQKKDGKAESDQDD